MSEATIEAVRHTVTVPLTRDQAFALFVDQFESWWPRDSHHISKAAAAVGRVEARPGGRWYERDDQGEECEWGRVLEVERPARILLAWQLTPSFEYEPDPAKQTEVEVTFEDQADATRVTLEHRGFEVWGPEGQKMRDSVGADGGWGQLLGLYELASRASHG
jgi:uncharacterized protein YndB with AHSA1/START domain